MTVSCAGLGFRIAVLIPCYNEAIAIPKVVADFRASLPDARIYVYDNDSSDGTIAAAREAGAVVRAERLQGKGHVVRRMFSDIEADIYVLVDGDDTYDAQAVPDKVNLLLQDHLDMVSAARVTELNDAYRRGHRLGNVVLTGIVRSIFGNRISDLLSGYRVFSRRFVKSCPALAAGFETETEFCVHALELRMPIGEVLTQYSVRPSGSASKLRTYVDGWRILRMIVVLVKEERPLQFFAVGGIVLLLLGLGFGIPVVTEFMRTGDGAARADGRSGDRVRGAIIPVVRVRPRAGFGCTRPQGNQAAGLSRDSRVGRSGRAPRGRGSRTTAAIGAFSIIAARAARCSSFNRDGWPGALRSIRPAAPFSFHRSTQSRTTCSVTPPAAAPPSGWCHRKSSQASLADGPDQGPCSPAQAGAASQSGRYGFG